MSASGPGAPMSQRPGAPTLHGPGAAAPGSFLIIDDHPLFCEALSLTLRTVHAESAVHVANTLGDGVARIEGGLEPDAILLDLNLPDTDSLDGLIRLRNARPETPVVVISSVTDNAMVARALRSGAAGFIPKATDRRELIDAFQRIWRGDVYTPPSYAAPEVEAPTPRAPRTEGAGTAIERLSDLTPQQARILELVCEGKLNKQIAFDLDIAESTVKAHITAILRKLNVQSRVQAVLVAQEARFGPVNTPQT